MAKGPALDSYLDHICLKENHLFPFQVFTIVINGSYEISLLFQGELLALRGDVSYPDGSGETPDLGRT